MNKIIQKITYQKKLLAYIVDEKNFLKPGVDFVTPNYFSLQLGFISHKKNYLIKPHTHKKFLRKIKKTTEILFIKSGILRVDFYENNKKYLFSYLIKKNQILILIDGSHGFKVIKKCRFIEVKQGPFSSILDKTRFKNVDEKKIKIKK